MAARPTYTRPHSGSAVKSFTRADIINHGLRIAANGGIKQLTMRTVADAMGVPVTSLYSQVGGKEEIVDGMVLCVMAAPLISGSPPSEWRRASRLLARRSLERLAAFPWVLSWRLEGGHPRVAAAHSDQIRDAYVRAGVALDDAEVAALMLDTFVVAGALGIAAEARRIGMTARLTSTGPGEDDAGEAATLESGLLTEAELSFELGLEAVIDAIAQRFRPVTEPELEPEPEPQPKANRYPAHSSRALNPPPPWWGHW